MKWKVAFSILVMFLAVTVLPCFADPPPTDPPAKPPRTSLSKLIGTWEGTVTTADEAGYSSYQMTLKITEQNDYMFRGYVSDPQGNFVFVAGVMDNSNEFILVQKDVTWLGDIWWSDTMVGISIGLSNPHVPSVSGGTLIKTTK